MTAYRKNASPQLTLEGHLERITYFNKDTHYTVARFKRANPATVMTVVGYLAGVSPGETIKIKGTWVAHRKYGQQFKIQSFAVTLPAAVDGIRNYLASGAIKGIGPSMAARMTKVFGADTLEIIEKNPARLLEVEGIGETKAAMIQSAWQEHHTLRTLMQFLQDMGVQTSYCAKMYKAYGPDAVDLIRADPYILAEDIPGAGFLIADTIARKLGVEIEDPERVRACIMHIILQNADDGHTFAEQENLVARCENQFQISPRTVEYTIDQMAGANAIVVEPIESGRSTSAIFMRELYRAETGLANRLKAMLSLPLKAAEIDPDRIAAAVHHRLAINLSAEQLAALEQIFSHRIAVITGGPGTGKTTLLRSISTIFETLGRRVLLAAPTGRAARRLSEVTGRKARTIHRLLGVNFTDGGFIRDRNNPLEADAVIVDEASMVDTVLMYHLIDAVPMAASLVMVGDVSQLPAIGPGNVLADMIDSTRIPVFSLNKIFRQDTESAIILNAHKVRQGDFQVGAQADVIDQSSDFYFVEEHDPDRVAQRIVQLCSRELPQKFDFDPILDIQVLTPMHKGAVGTINLNHMLQKTLNRQPVLVEAMGNAYKAGDKVMHLINNYQKEVYNGDIGVVRNFDQQKDELTVDYYGQTVCYDTSELDQITIAYAISVHKSQGSEYPAVIVPLVTQHYVLLQRNLLYTAMTRGKKMVILIGSPKALHIALKNDKPRMRLTSLAGRLG
ncbi:RecD-like DNA helicase YrrC [Olavius sp. associated proteobacterium Delta 1]|nr:RecD-like DNA helicase YrrC [Olavius sp. associated proteobacterium Delta 1]